MTSPRSLADIIQANVSLQRQNTLALPASAAYYAAPASLQELMAVVKHCQRKAWPLYLLGGGSNVIMAPRINGLVLHYAAQNYWLEHTRNGPLLHVEAGVAWPELVEDIARQGYWGIENLALIPGCAGAAPVQNIGAYGVELSDVLKEVHCLDLQTLQPVVLSHAECAFGYRDSIFKGALAGRMLITRIVLKLSESPTPRLDYADLAQRIDAPITPARVAGAVSAIRREKLPDPQQLANAGSFFKNPVVSAEQAQQLVESYPQMPRYPAPNGVKLAAGWLLDQCGLKGARRGHFGVHERQALVLVHFGGGNGNELMTFASALIDKVRATFSVELEPEPRKLGW